MGVRPIDNFIPAFRNKNAKCLALQNDIYQIIKERIQYCELTDFPYSLNSMSAATWAANRVFSNVFYEKTKKTIKDYEIPFVMQKVKEQDGSIHIYASFNISAWDHMIEEAIKNVDKN